MKKIKPDFSPDDDIDDDEFDNQDEFNNEDEECDDDYCDEEFYDEEEEYDDYQEEYDQYDDNDEYDDDDKNYRRSVHRRNFDEEKSCPVSRPSSSPSSFSQKATLQQNQFKNSKTDHQQTKVSNIIAIIIGVKQYTKKKYKTGDSVPELFGQIDAADVKLLLRGNKAVGGPIDFMYIGPMDVTYTYKDGVCTLNGNFYSIEDYYKKVGGKLYIRARKRREDQPFTKDEVDKEGLPLIYGKSKTKSDRGRRIVVADKAPTTAITYNIPKVGK
jgi:hypothetical protein